VSGEAVVGHAESMCGAAHLAGQRLSVLFEMLFRAADANGMARRQFDRRCLDRVGSFSDKAFRTARRKLNNSA
jgi:hypothetical protein